MSIFGSKGGGLFGSLLGIALAFASGGASIALSSLATYAAVGFSIGSLLFPPEFDEDAEEFKAPDVKEGSAIPLIFGRQRTRGVITYFDETQVKVEKDGDTSKLYWAPMQVAVCVCEKGPTNDVYRSLYAPFGLSSAPTALNSAIAEEDKIGIIAIDGQDPSQEAKSYPYFPYKAGNSFYKFSVGLSGDIAEIIKSIEGYTVNYGSYTGGEDLETNFTIDVMTKSWPQVSWGSNAVYQYDKFSDPSWIPDLGSLSIASMSWDALLPPLKNILTLSSPVWSLGSNTSTARNDIYEVWGIYPFEPGALFVEILTNKLWGAGLDVSGLNLNTFTGGGNLSSLQLFANAEGLEINAVVKRQKAESLIDRMNFHLGTIIREDHLGRLEVLAVRSLVDGPTFTQAQYESWVDAGSPDSGGAYTPGFPVLYKVYDGDATNLSISNQLWSSTKNSFIARFQDASNSYVNSSVVVKDNSTREQTGGYKIKSFTFDMFTDRDAVTSRLIQLAQSKSRPGATARMDISLRFFGIRPGDGIQLWNKDKNVSGAYFRVVSVEEPKLGENTITVDTVLDMESLYTKNLFSVVVQAPALGKEPSTPDDPDDPIGISAHPDFWDHNLAYTDSTSTIVNNKKTHLYVAQGNLLQVAHNDFSVEGVLNPYVGVPIPQTALGSQQDSKWGFKFLLMTPLAKDGYHSSHDGDSLLLQLVGYDKQDLTTEPFFGTKTDLQLETSQTVLILSGRPDNKNTTEYVTEIIRFRTVEKISQGMYKVSLLARGANKESPKLWSIGTEVWIANLSDPTKNTSLPYDLWPNRSLAKPKLDAEIDQGSHRVRVFTQSVTLTDATGELEGSGTAQPADEGLSATYDALNSQFFSGSAYHDAKLSPMVSSAAIRVGDIKPDSGLWFRKDLAGVVNLLSDPYDLSTWLHSGLSTSPSKYGLAYAPGNLAVSEVSWTGTATKTLSTSITSGLTDGLTYSCVFLISNESESFSEGEFSTFSASFFGNGTTDSSVSIDWNSGVVSTVGSASAYDMGNGTYRVFMSSTRLAGNDLKLFCFFSGTVSGISKKAGLGEVLIYLGGAEALYTEGDWLVQFLPMGQYGGIGDFSLVTGAPGSAWGEIINDDDESLISTNQAQSVGTYKVSARVHSYLGVGTDLILASYPDVVTVTAGDFWPTLVISGADLAAHGMTDVPVASGDFHPKQLELFLAKQGSGGYYNSEIDVNKKGPWSSYYSFFTAP